LTQGLLYSKNGYIKYLQGLFIIKQSYSERLTNLYDKGVPSYRQLGTLVDLQGVGIFEPLKDIDNTLMRYVKVLREASESI